MLRLTGDVASVARLSRAPRRGSLVKVAVLGGLMTQQYIAGEFSLLLAELESAPQGTTAVHALRRTVELSPLEELPRLVREALGLTDLVCWAALDQGDVTGFCGSAKTAVALAEFAENARLAPE
jgi:hypothetical protein